MGFLNLRDLLSFAWQIADGMVSVGRGVVWPSASQGGQRSGPGRGGVCLGLSGVQGLHSS